MGRLPGHRQVTLYVDDELYERVRVAAYLLGKDIYEFVGIAFKKAVDDLVPKSDRAALEVMVRQNLKNGGPGRRRGKRPAL
jgi:hypothetical protein